MIYTTLLACRRLQLQCNPRAIQDLTVLTGWPRGRVKLHGWSLRGKVNRKLNFRNGEWFFFKANDITCHRKLQLNKDIVIISQDFLSLVPFII